MQTLLTSVPGGENKQRAERILGVPVLAGPWNRQVTITPDLAEALLSSAPPQRPLNSKKIDWFAALIASGRFLTTHQGLAANTRGELFDGQHRLRACIQAGRNIVVQFSFNQPNNNFVAFDGRGATRTLADHLVTDGTANARVANLLQASAKLIWHFDAGRLPWHMGSGTEGLLFDLFEVNGVLIRHPLLMSMTKHYMGKQTRSPKAPKAPLVAFGTLFREVDEELAMLFVDQIITGEQLVEGDPAFVLRNALGSSLSRRMQEPRNAFMVRLVRAWNNVRDGRRVKKLYSVLADGKFPEISGYKRPASGDMLVRTGPMLTDEFEIRGLYRNDDVDVRVVKRLFPTQIAELARDLISRWGMVACELDGEDSAGRAKLKLSTPAVVVARACDAAELAFDEFARRGWLVELPSPAEARAQLRAEPKK